MPKIEPPWQRSQTQSVWWLTLPQNKVHNLGRVDSVSRIINFEPTVKERESHICTSPCNSLSASTALHLGNAMAIQTLALVRWWLPSFLDHLSKCFFFFIGVAPLFKISLLIIASFFFVCSAMTAHSRQRPPSLCYFIWCWQDSDLTDIYLHETLWDYHFYHMKQSQTTLTSCIIKLYMGPL